MAPKKTKFHETITSLEHFEKIIEEKKKIIFIDCHQEWCGPCKSMEPSFQTIWFSYDDPANRMEFWQCVEENIPDRLREKMDLTLVPRFLIYQGGEQRAEIQGVRYNQVLEAFEKYIPELNE